VLCRSWCTCLVLQWMWRLAQSTLWLLLLMAACGAGAGGSMGSWGLAAHATAVLLGRWPLLWQVFGRLLRLVRPRMLGRLLYHYYWGL
jgi:hypothetical protein